ncbi:hypothetical protein MUN89_02040 [Halobacillus salinarum]|uniref:Nucleotidyltransferase domain protein n=1 Tax=Halobacillus salinarum TaxID=2932257 RepID=A0ABY4EL04_9BACI|nr:hypothetical protein [Halobacillus salinarum]UOQ44761.1 hypothetical protein MUN89_02040 [Halobacillus salinarum]
MEKTVQTYVEAVVDTFGEHIAGIYQYGSGGIGAFNPEQSDWDLIVFFQTKRQVKEHTTGLRSFHEQLLLENRAFANRLDVMFLPVPVYEKDPGEISPYPFMNEGVFTKRGTTISMLSPGGRSEKRCTDRVCSRKSALNRCSMKWTAISMTIGHPTLKE